MDSVVRLLEDAQKRASSLMAVKQSMVSGWQDIQTFMYPYAGEFEKRGVNQGSPDSSKILNEKAQKAIDTLAAGFDSGMTNRSNQWFRVGVFGGGDDETPEVRRWCDKVQEYIMAVTQNSNFYGALHQVYVELAAFGNAALIILFDHEDVIRCTSLTAGTYAFGKSRSDRVDTLYREFDLNASQMVHEFGLDNVSQQVRDCFYRDPDSMFTVCNLVEPSPDARDEYAFRALYWESGARDRVLRYSGFNSCPVMCPRWSLKSNNDVYGYGAARKGLATAKQLQVYERDKLMALEKMINPPLVASASLLGSAVRTNPNGVTYVPDGLGPRITELSTVKVSLQDIQFLISQAERNLDEIMYVNLFMMLPEVDSGRMTASEVMVRQREKMLLLGSVLERLEVELLKPAIERIFDVLLEAELLPEPPGELMGKELKIEYVSMLAQAQKSTAASPMEQALAFVQGVAAVGPEVLDNLNLDAVVREYVRLVGAPALMLKSDDELEEMRRKKEEAREKMMQMQQAAMGADAAASVASGAKDLAQTELGGTSALEALLGSLGGMGSEGGTGVEQGAPGLDLGALFGGLSEGGVV